MPQVSNLSWTLVFILSLIFFFLIMNNIYFYNFSLRYSFRNFNFSNFKFYFFL